MAAEESKKESEAAPEGAAELKDEALDQASGGAVDAFIYFNEPGEGMSKPTGETMDSEYEVRDPGFGFQPGREKRETSG